MVPVLEAGKSLKRKRGDVLCPGTAAPASQLAVFLPCPPVVEGERQLSDVSFIKASVPLTRTSLSRPDCFPEATPLNTDAMEERISTSEWGEADALAGDQ